MIPDPNAAELAALRDQVADARALYAKDTEAGVGALASALVQLTLGSMGSGDEDLIEETASEAIEVLLQCLERTPDPQDEAHLASVLHVHGLMLMISERDAEAMASAQQVVAFFRKRIDTNPDYRRGLALGLEALAMRGFDEDAPTLLSEAVALRQQVADDDPAALPTLLDAQVSLAYALEGLDRDEEALDVLVAFCDHGRNVVADDALFKSAPDMVTALGAGLQLKASLERLYAGEEEAALESSLALDALNRKAASLDPAMLPMLIESATLVCELYVDLEQPEPALTRATEAVETYRAAIAEEPSSTLSAALARSLGLVEAALSELERYDEAVVVIQEAIQIYRGLLEELGPQSPGTLRAAMAAELNDLGVALSNLDRNEEALEATREAVGLFGQLAVEDPEEHLANLADSLDNLSTDLGELGHLKEALEAAQDAIQIFRSLLEGD